MRSRAELQSRQRIGWVFLLIAFAIFFTIAVSIPLTVNAYLQNTTQPLPTSVQANQGTVRIGDRSGIVRATLPGEEAESVESGAEILTDATATALVFLYPPDNERILARLQVYGNTDLQLDRVEAPRFQVSTADHRLDLTLERGRLRITVPEYDGRPFTIRINAPQGGITIREPGQFSVEVSEVSTQLAVGSGKAVLSGATSSLSLLSDQRAYVENDGVPVGPLSTERNLMQNGDFSSLFDQWTLFTWTIERADQPEGETNIIRFAGEPALRISRSGTGHADVRLRQAINQDVADYESLQLFLTFRIVEQSLSVCGIRGSECPLFIRVNYIDDSGTGHTWQQGFYAFGQANSGSAPDACVSCDVAQTRHQLVQMGRVYFYEVDIRSELARQGYLPPRFIESVSLVASGHSFEVDVVDVALMAKE